MHHLPAQRKACRPLLVDLTNNSAGNTAHKLEELEYGGSVEWRASARFLALTVDIGALRDVWDGRFVGFTMSASFTAGSINPRGPAPRRLSIDLPGLSFK